MSESTSRDEIHQLLGVLRRRRWAIFMCVVAVPLAALGLSLLQTKKYAASASLLFRDPSFDQKLFGSNFAPQSRDADREAATNVRLVRLRPVALRSEARL